MQCHQAAKFGKLGHNHIQSQRKSTKLLPDPLKCDKGINNNFSKIFNFQVNLVMTIVSDFEAGKIRLSNADRDRLYSLFCLKQASGAL